MLNNVLAINNQNIKVNEESFFRQDYAIYNEVKIQLNTQRNFSRTEFDALYTKAFRNDWIDSKIEDFVNLDNLDKSEGRYSRLLALYRRIDLDFYKNISNPLRLNAFPLDTIENFKVFDELFERYYDSFTTYDCDNKKLKENFKKESVTFTLRLWLAGYGILPGYTKNHITDELLSDLFKFTRTRSRVGTLLKYIRFISFALSQEDNSPVTEPFNTTETTSLIDREIGKWDKVIGKSALGKIFKDFTFEQILSRTNAPFLLEYTDSKVKVIRITEKQITLDSFTNYSGGLRDMFLELQKLNIDSIEGALNGGILNVLSATRDSWGRTKYDTMKATTKFWVKWYIAKNNLDLNIRRIIPPANQRRDTKYGIVLNTSDTVELIDILRNDNSPFYENSTIIDYRCRYIALLMLSSGQRISAVSCLSYDCLKKNKNGDLRLIFHKTKSGDGCDVPATPDIVKYVNKLREHAPKLEIYFPSDKYAYADDLRIRRLVANQFNNGPISDSTVNRFLRKIQVYLWGADFEKYKDKVFTCHDFRRMKATYMKWSGYSDEDIQKQLGQTDINSQLPYLQTKPSEHQEAFSNIYNQGVYKIDDNGDVLINKNRVFDKAVELSEDSDSESHKLLIKSILKNIKNADELSIKTVDTTVLEPTGFPIGIYSCSASQLVNCNKSPIHCFGCDSYVPDEDSIDNHKIELFRYMILSQYHSKSIKSTKDAIVKSIVSQKIITINESIDEAFNNLFSKFKLDKKEVDKIKSGLESAVKSYSRKEMKSKPSPTFKEAKKYLLDKGAL